MMLRLSYWSICLIIFSRFTGNQAAIKWKVLLCFQEELNFVSITLDKVTYVNATSEEKQSCFHFDFELENATKPSFVGFEFDNATESSSMNFTSMATVESYALGEHYEGECNQNYCNETMISLKKMVHWTVEVTRNQINEDFKGSFHTPYVKVNINFRTFSRTVNKSFWIQKEDKDLSNITIYPKGYSWFDKKVKLKNMETSQIYSCVLGFYHFAKIAEQTCFLTNDSTWKIELTSPSELKNDTKQMNITFGMVSSESKSSEILTFRKLAFLPSMFALTNIPNITTRQVEIDFKDHNKVFRVSQIVMTKMLTGEKYGCANINKRNTMKYSCKILKGKNWLLKVISPEEQERNFSVETVQGTLSSFTEQLRWNSFCSYGDSYIKYFNLQTYGDNEITNINLHFDDKPLRINEMSLISNYSEYKFERNEERNAQNSSEARFSRITKGTINSSGSIVAIETVIGLLAVITSILLIIVARYLILKRNASKNSLSVCDVATEDKMCRSKQNTNSFYIKQPGQKLFFEKQNPEGPYEDRDSNPLLKESAEDGGV